MQNESGFVSRLRKREEKAFTELYTENGTALYNYIRCRVRGNAEAAEDILAEVFSDAIDHVAALTPLHNVRAWLFRIAKSKVADHFRRLAKEGKWRTGTPVETVANGKGHGLDPALQYSSAAEKAVVRAAFAELPDDYREVLRRMYIEEESMKQIAAALERSEKSVESLLYRARMGLEAGLARLAREHGRHTTGGNDG